MTDRHLYLPDASWCQDAERRTRAGVPDQTTFATKPTLAGQMISAALDAGIGSSWVTGDEAYGQDPGLRALLESRDVGYLLAVACGARVRINQGRTAARGCRGRPAARLGLAPAERRSRGEGAALLRLSLGRDR
ncbi:transposase [Kitasatospora sp. RB6PN24]|nr:transposase [Kitasatospora humi]MCC9307109.1 transposase [Kitasatospora humi]